MTEEGEVGWFNEKGFGFIKHADGKDVFVDSSVVEGHLVLKEGDKVRFQVEPGIREGSRKATNVARL